MMAAPDPEAGRSGDVGGFCAVAEIRDQPAVDEVNASPIVIWKSGPGCAQLVPPASRKAVVVTDPPPIAQSRVTSPSVSRAVVAVTAAVTPSAVSVESVATP